MDIARKVILLVEDNEDQADAIIKKVEAIGKYKVVWAKDGYEGLAQVRKHGRFMGFAGNKLSCILLDMQMPNMNGVQFLEKLRKREKWRLFEHYLPVIFLTAYKEKDYYRSAMNEYACEYLNKPVEQAELAAVLKRILEDYDYFSAVESNRKNMKDKIRSFNQQASPTKQTVTES